MIFWDVNLWVYAFRKDCPLHEKARNLLIQGMENREGFLFSPVIASSFLRLVTNRKIFSEPSLPGEAWDFIDVLEIHENAHFVEYDRTAYGIFKHLTLVAGAEGNLIPDAFLAALAIRHDCRFVTTDRGFQKYPGLQVELVA
ncbi:MAG: PIN domain-containing protein [Spirochaetaceae bacterium]|nr:PIN domain-containing protein [Spirochaetaceae bacterium]MCF7939796.1 PIN domain-containing protein [Spirochaetales bacterium]